MFIQTVENIRPPSFENLSPFKQQFLVRFLIFFLLFGLFLFPVIHANFHYNDDWFHIGTDVNVMRDGRPIQQLVLSIFSNFSIRDVAPLPQIGGAFFAAAGAALASIALEYSVLTGTLALSLLFCNELFLENLSYRYEALGMGLAMGLSLAAFYAPVALQKRSCLIQRSAEAFVLILAFASYLPTVNIYGGLTCVAAIMAILHHHEIKEVWKTLITRMAAFSVSLIIYRILIAIVPPFHDIYSGTHVGLASSPQQAAFNYGAFFHFFKLLVQPWEYNSLYGYNFLLFLLLLLASIALIYHFFLLLKGKDVPLKILSVLLFIAGIFLFFAGPMFLLASPVFTPRTMCGIPVILTAAASIILTTDLSKNLHKAVVAYCSYLLFGALIASCAYSNASNALETYRLTLDGQMRDDLTDFFYSPIEESLEKEGFFLKFIMVGDKGRFRPDVVQFIQDKYPVFREIFIQKATWFTVFPAMGFDLMRMNLIGGGSLNPGTPPFVWPFWDLNPDTFLVQRIVEEKVKNCDVTDIKKHSIFFTYRIGSNIIFDYDQRCSKPMQKSNLEKVKKVSLKEERERREFLRNVLAGAKDHFFVFDIFSPEERAKCLKPGHINSLDSWKWMGLLADEEYQTTEFTSGRLATPIDFRDGLDSCQANEITKMINQSEK